MFLLWQAAHWLRKSVFPASAVGAAVELSTKMIELIAIKRQNFNELRGISKDVIAYQTADFVAKITR
jgi:hypothetical protein